ncbi:MAG TPA: peroxiredoxin [candidate division Zixibacteria bacterium]|nr:peroxiredoxin [candidate division Zixibacteria bacterium]
MAIRTGQAVWEGNLVNGKGTVKLGSGAFEGQYSFSSRFEEGKGTNPEELIGAAHAGCFSMAFSAALTEAGFIPKRIETTASVHLQKGDKGFGISLIELNTSAQVPGIDNNRFQEIAESAKKNCPVSQALAAVEIKLQAHLTT